MSQQITIQTLIQAPITKVWEYWTLPEHVTKWNHASDDWECPYADNDLRPGGKFTFTMAAKDKSSSFDFTGTYNTVQKPEYIEYTMPDGRNVATTFTEVDGSTMIVTVFDPEDENSIEMQRSGWQSILDNFKKYVESR